MQVFMFNFTNGVISIWNSLSNHVVSVDTINTFKDRLDKFWSNQDVLYDYKADLHGIGIHIGLMARPSGITSNFTSRAFSSTWNSLPTHIRSLDKLSTFKHELKSHLFQSTFAV